MLLTDEAPNRDALRQIDMVSTDFGSAHESIAAKNMKAIFAKSSEDEGMTAAFRQYLFTEQANFEQAKSVQEEETRRELFEQRAREAEEERKREAEERNRLEMELIKEDERDYADEDDESREDQDVESDLKFLSGLNRSDLTSNFSSLLT